MHEKAKGFLFVTFVAALSALAGCGLDDLGLNTSEIDDDFVCGADLEWPADLKKSDPLERLKNYCLNAQGLGHAWKNCLALPLVGGAQACSDGTFTDRERATRLQNEPRVQVWAKEIRGLVRTSDDISLLSPDDDLVTVVRTVGNRVADSRIDPHFEGKFEFNVYTSSSREWETNAFAIPGGGVYIGKALLKKMDESQLAYVLGHEIAHIEWSSFDQEILEMFAQRDLLDRIGGLLLDVCEGPFDEVQTDLFGIEYALAAGYDPSAAARLFWGEFRDFKDLSAFSPFESHPPSSMRASWAWMRAESLLETGAAYFCGHVGQDPIWDGLVPKSVSSRCGEEGK